MIKPIAAKPRQDYRIWVKFEDRAEGDTDRSDIAEQFSRLGDGDRYSFENDTYFLPNPNNCPAMESLPGTNTLSTLRKSRTFTIATTGSATSGQPQ